MNTTRHYLHHPTRFVSDTIHELTGRPVETKHKALLAGGLVLAAVGVAAVIWVLPEIRRYARIERM